MKRILTAAALIVLVAPAIRFGHPAIIWSLLGLAAILSVLELRPMLARFSGGPWPALSLAGTLAVMASFAFDPIPLAPVLTACVVIVLIRSLLADSPPEASVARLAATLVTVLYLGLTFGHLAGLLALQMPGAKDRGDIMILAMVAVYVGDTSAMYVGRAMGRTKFAPAISPGKTWEGVVAGILGSIGGALLAPLWFAHAISVPHAIVLGVILGLAGLAGDLVESLFKRAAAIKDSGTLLPGHGGVLDRVDSLLLAAPVLYWYQKLILLGGWPWPTGP